jgi:hypothetical protein
MRFILIGVLFVMVLFAPLQGAFAAGASSHREPVAVPHATSSPAHKAELEAGAFTPPPGSEERRAIMDALRKVVREMSGLDVVFVVTFLKVQDGWAWVETAPQSADGKNHYEPMSGLLHRAGGAWQYVAGPPEGAVCEEDPDCADQAKFFKKLQKQHPGVPAAIFPAGVPSVHP